MRPARPLFATALVCALSATAVARAQPPGPPSARDFVNAAGQSDQYEIQAGRVALTQSRDSRIRAFAQQMVEDHTRTSGDLQAAAAASGLPPPPQTMSADQSRMLSALQSQKGPEFDRTYVTQQVDAHTAALTTVSGYAATGTDPNRRRTAQSAAPLIRRHLDMARQMKAQVAGGG